MESVDSLTYSSRFTDFQSELKSAPGPVIQGGDQKHVRSQVKWGPCKYLKRQVSYCFRQLYPLKPSNPVALKKDRALGTATCRIDGFSWAYFILLLALKDLH